MKALRLLVVADIGGPGDYHLGDEGMLEANLRMFRRLAPDIGFTVASRDPAWTSARYGVESVRTPFLACPFEDSPVTAEAWAARLDDEPAGALQEADALVISGGGNLCRTWPEKVVERVALMARAKELGKPIVILGQTLGPALSVDQRRLLAETLPAARWLGVREDSSATLAAELGVPADRIHVQLDDAFFLEPQPVEDARAEPLRRERRPWILVTLDSSFASAALEGPLSTIASQLDALADSLNAALVFVPHVGGSDLPAASTDAAAGQALAARLRSPLLILDLWQPREVRWLAAQAAMAVSTRYHPLVFSAAAGVVAMGIYADDYTRTKLRGALAPCELENYCISLADAERGMLLPLAMELWHRRKTVQCRLARLHAQASPRERSRQEAICRSLLLEPEVGAPIQGIAGIAPTNHREVEDSIPESLSGVHLSEVQWRLYEQQGYLLLGKILNESQLAALRERLDAIMLGQVRYPTLQMQLDTGGAYEDLPEPIAGLSEVTLAYRKLQGLEADPLVLELIRRDLFREICARIYGKHASISIFRAMLMNKPSGKGTYLPWHQDAGDVWKLDRDPLVTTWIALDPATRMNGCVQVIPGSHRLGLLSRNGSTVRPEQARIYCPDDAIAYLEVEAGEAILLHNWLLHRSDVNRTGSPRRALSACYMDGRTLSTLSGSRFPILFGEYEEAQAGMPFLQGIQEENRRLREAAVEARRYAESLLEDNRNREQMRRDAVRYAESLLEDSRNREQMRCEAVRCAESLMEDNRNRTRMLGEAERYAKSLEEELARVRAALEVQKK